MKQPITIVEKKVTKKPKSVSYEVFHVVEKKDVEGNPVLMREPYGMTTVRQLEAEIVEYQINIDYRKNLIKEIERIDKEKDTGTNVKEAILKFQDSKLEN